MMIPQRTKTCPLQIKKQKTIRAPSSRAFLARDQLTATRVKNNTSVFRARWQGPRKHVHNGNTKLGTWHPVYRKRVEIERLNKVRNWIQQEGCQLNMCYVSALTLTCLSAQHFITPWPNAHLMDLQVKYDKFVTDSKLSYRGSSQKISNYLTPSAKISTLK